MNVIQDKSKYEPYLDEITNKETGGHKRIPRNERFCTICTNTCWKYKKLWGQIIQPIIDKGPNIASHSEINKFIYLLSAEGDIARRLSNFCTLAKQRRTAPGPDWKLWLIVFNKPYNFQFLSWFYIYMYTGCCDE